MKTDAIIIGGGISGLTAAALLAAGGRQVVIVEKQPRVGGALKQFRRDGIAFDVGFHYTGCLGKNEILSVLWQYCDILPRLKVLPFPAEGHDRLVIDGHDEPIRAYFCSSRLADELARHFPAERLAIDRYLREIHTICRSIPFYNFDVPLLDFLRSYKRKDLSLMGFLRQISDNPFLQAALAAHSILYGVPTSSVSVDVHAMVTNGYYNGAYGIAGGGQAIVDAFQARLSEMGATFLTDRAVTSIRIDDHGAAGVITDKEEIIESPLVIHSGHPTALVDMVPQTCFRSSYRKRLKYLRNSLSMFALFGTIAAGPDTRAALDWTNHLFVPAGPNPLPLSSRIPSSKRPLMLTCTERAPDNTLLPKTKSVILLQPALWTEVEEFSDSLKGQRPSAYTYFKQAIREDMLQIAASKWGNFLGPIQVLTVGTPLTFRDELNAPEGGTYGAMHSLNQFNPQPRTRVPGLYLTGQSTLMTGLVGASISGMVTAGEILGLESLWQDILQWR
jgi:phytoene dehydrogenase-like protein